jgi:hypothetical protein
MNRTLRLAVAAAALLLGAVTAQADSRDHGSRNGSRGDGYGHHYGTPGGHDVRDHRGWRGERGGRHRDHRRYGRDDRYYGWRDEGRRYGHFQGYRHRGHYWRDHDRHYWRGGYRGDHRYYGRDSDVDLDVVIYLPLW